MGKFAKKPLEKKVIVPQDDELVEALERADQDLGRAQLLEKGVEEARAARDAAMEALEAGSIVIRLRALSRPDYQALLDLYPPTPEENEEHRAKHGFDALYSTEKFAPALVLASLNAAERAHGEPETTEEEFLRDLWTSDDWNAGEVSHLFNEALQVNTARRVADLGN